jgi:hypothetical protein
MPRLSIITHLGDLTFDFTDTEDLKKQVEKLDLEAVGKIVEEKFDKIMLEIVKRVRDDIGDLVETDGRYMIFKKIPKAKIDMVILAIYAYGTSATIDEIRRTTGILDPSGDAINAGASRKYFILIDKEKPAYGLSPEGLQKVMTEIIPSLRQKKEDDAGKGKG